MPGFMNADGSELVGARLPDGSGAALSLDDSGHLLVRTSSAAAGSELVGARLPDGSGAPLSLDDSGHLLVHTSSGAAADGCNPTVPGFESIAFYTSGGPPLASGLPTQLAFDRWRSWLGLGSQSNSLVRTLSGAQQLTFNAPPRTLLPGSALRLSGSTRPEYVYVAPDFIPSSTATVIPLASPVVNADQATATWSIFSPFGPADQSVPPEGIAMVQETLLDVATGNLYAKQGSHGIQDTSVGGRVSLAIDPGTATNTLVRTGPGRLARILVTTAGSGAMSIFDSATTSSGTKIALVPPNASPGTLIDCQAPALAGIIVAGNANNPGVTIFYY